MFAPDAAPDRPDTSTYYLVHRAMRTSSAQLTTALTRLDLGDRRRARAIALWYRGFAGELLAHHSIEDELFFPSLAEQVPGIWAAYEADLAADHEHLDHVMAGLQAALDTLADGTPEWTAVQRRAVVLGRELRDHLTDHLRVEDDEVIPLFERHYTAEEYDELDQAALKHMKVGQMWFTLPWMMAGCTPEERGRLLAGAPAPLLWLWKAARAGYAKRASYALGITVPARPPWRDRVRPDQRPAMRPDRRSAIEKRSTSSRFWEGSGSSKANLGRPPRSPFPAGAASRRSVRSDRRTMAPSVSRGPSEKWP